MGVWLTTQRHPVPKIIVELYLYSPTCINGVVLNEVTYRENFTSHGVGGEFRIRVR
jgi:hypothetical protein